MVKFSLEYMQRGNQDWEKALPVGSIVEKKQLFMAVFRKYEIALEGF